VLAGKPGARRELTATNCCYLKEPNVQMLELWMRIAPSLAALVGRFLLGHGPTLIRQFALVEAHL